MRTRGRHMLRKRPYRGPVHARRKLPTGARRKANGLREVGLLLVTAGLVVLLFVAYELVGTNLSEEHSQARLARAFNSALAEAPAAAGQVSSGRVSGTTTTSATVPKGRATPPERKASPHKPPPLSGVLPLTPPGGALDHLVIPAIGVDRYVVQGVSETDLQMGPGHYPGTPLPGQVGNVGIAGHRTTFGAPFFRLNEVNRGDLVYLTDTSGTTWVYRVVRQLVVPPTDVAVLDATRDPELTLTTCNPRFEATSRLVVRAVLVKRLARGTRVPKPLPVLATREGGFPGPGALLAARPTRRAQPAQPASHVRAATSERVVPSATSTSSPSATATTLVTATALVGSGGAGSDFPTVGPGPASASLTTTGGTGAWAGALGWGALALAGWVATRIAAARKRRYDKVLVLLGGALVCLVPLWFAFGNVVDLLPANI